MLKYYYIDMRSPNFNKTSRDGAITLSRGSAFGEIVNNKLENLEPLPEPNTDEAQHLLNDLKPLFYAAIAQVIDKIIDFDASPLNPRNPEVMKILTTIPMDRDAIDILELFLRQKFLKQAEEYFDADSESVEVVTLQNLIDINKRLGAPSWDTAQWAIHGGLGTMLDHIKLCFKSYYQLANQDERDLDEITVSMGRSFSDLTNATLLNTLQILAIAESLSDGTVPEAIYDKERDQYRFKEELDQVILTNEFKKELINKLLFHGETKLVHVVESATKIADLSQITETIGCPITFRPQHVQKIWLQAVEQAVVLGLL
jgi:hypothetical protein